MTKEELQTEKKKIHKRLREIELEQSKLCKELIVIVKKEQKKDNEFQ